jgi:beta-phosphoglucomutase-like phosphatase (HAD superfamily)
MIPLQDKVEAVIFDMDGVLIDARDWHYRALNEALAIFDASIPFEEHLERFNGLPTSVKLEMLSEEGRLPSHVHGIVNSVKQERTLREAAALCFPRVEHLLLMAWLKEKSLKIGVATNSIRHTSQTMLGFAGLLDSIDLLLTNEDVSSPKPAPDIYLKAAAQLNVLPRNVLVIEDHDYGVAAAKMAGSQVVRVDGIEDVTVSLLERWIVASGSETA